MNTNLPSSQKLSKIYSLLAENGIDPNNFSVDISQPNWEGSDEIQKVLTSVRGLTDFANVENWIEGDYNYNNLIRDASISVDITNNPFQIGKIMLAMDNLEISTDRVSQEQLTNSLEEVESLLSDFAIEVDTEMRNNSLFIEMDNSFTKVFDDNPVEDNPNSFQVKKNTKIAKLALSTKVTSQIQDVIGKDRLKQMRTLGKKHVSLSKQRTKQLSDIKNSKLKKEVDSQKTDC